MSGFVNPWVIWLSPACERCCLLPRDREWCQEDIWGACQDCGAMAVRYALSPLREGRAATVDNREGPCPGCVNPGCRHGGCQGRKPLDRLSAPQPEPRTPGTAPNTDIAQPKADPHGEPYRDAILSRR